MHQNLPTTGAFMRIQEPDQARITVRLWKGERDSIYGEILLPVGASPELVIPVCGPKSPAEAIAVAVVLARRLHVDVAIVDHENLWNPSWGPLQQHGTVKPASGAERKE